MIYPTNSNYTIDEDLFSTLTEHMERMRDRYSDIIPLRMDFAYKKSSILFNERCYDHWDIDMYRLAERAMRTDEVIGYAWVMEYTPTHGLHFHAIFYLDGQCKRNSYCSARSIAEEWRDITQNMGTFRNCQKETYHKVSGVRNLHHLDDKGYRDLAFILSYMAKEEQKDILDTKVCYTSDVPTRSRSGRPRLLSLK